MRDYSKVSSAFWTGKTGKSLRGNQQAQIVAIYLMTCPHANMIGVFHCPIIYIAHETGSTIEGATKGLNDLVEGAFCTYDHDAETVWVHEMAKYQIGENLSPNDKQVIGIKKQYANLPSGLIKQGFFARYKDDYLLAVKSDLPKPLASPLQAPTKPEAGTEAGTGTEAEVNTSHQQAGNDDEIQEGLIPCPHQEIINLYAKHLPMGTQVKIWTDARKLALRTRWREDTNRQSLDWWGRLFAYIAKSNFLTSKISDKDGRSFEISLDWIIKSANFVKIIEGKYDNKAAA